MPILTSSPFFCFSTRAVFFVLRFGLASETISEGLDLPALYKFMPWIHHCRTSKVGVQVPQILSIDSHLQTPRGSVPTKCFA
ncbi:hypothetical protein IWZ03DRAFT_49292 [Phyllosticta citriasiana]|uniref:Secreted protein n=1 Tax=Phyllosticta citriasiana TaxID=595635 RepID=A0ABR1KC06_9PEZI